MTLPWNWNDFNTLISSLSENDKQMALEAYYKNKNHSAWRFLAKPNPWMHPDALYTKHSGVEQWSYFDDYIELIAVLFLAAKDENISGIDGFDIESRITQFIDELALIGRSHNWDNKNTKQQEYDDLKGDRPSCYSGTKRRLFQSVQGHPLLKQLTLDILQQELQEFVWQHFQKVITTDNQEIFSSIWQKSINIEMLTVKEEETLSKTNISEEDQISWIKKLQNKYGDQINRYKVGLLQRFNLSDHESHFIHFGYLNLDQLLEKPTLQKESSDLPLSFMKNSSNDTNISLRFFDQKSHHNDNNNVLNVCNLDK